MIKLPVLLLLHEGPFLEIPVRKQVFLPCRLDGWFERQHEYMLPSHAQGQLIGGKGLSEAHLGIPEEMSSKSLIGFVGSKRPEICRSLSDRLFLFGSHLEVQGTLQECNLIVPHCLDSLFHLSRTASEPFSPWILNVRIKEYLMYSLVAEHRTILAHGRPNEFHFPRLSGNKRRIMFFHPHVNTASRKAHFEHTGIACVGIGIDDRPFRHWMLK